MKTKAMRTKVLTQAVILANIKRLRNNKLNKHNENRLKYWLTRQNQLSATVTKAQKGVNGQA